VERGAAAAAPSDSADGEPELGRIARPVGLGVCCPRLRPEGGGTGAGICALRPNIVGPADRGPDFGLPCWPPRRLIEATAGGGAPLLQQLR